MKLNGYEYLEAHEQRATLFRSNAIKYNVSPARHLVASSGPHLISVEVIGI
jgi:hypothetical protein